MAKFEAGMESMVDMYIFESSSLIEQLDQILMTTENKSNFSDEDINEIFRIMHTIKGSSAMMGLENMSKLAHIIEDMFYIIREEKPEITNITALYDVLFSASDLLKAEIELIQEEVYTPTDFSECMGKITAFVNAIKNGGQVAEAPAKTASAPAKKQVEIDEDMFAVRITFDEDCKMENLRALLVVSKITEECKKLEYFPADIETNSDTIKEIVDNGFIVKFIPADGVDFEAIMDTIATASNVKSFEMLSDEEVAYSGSQDKPVGATSASGATEIRVNFETDCRMENLRALILVNNIKDSCDTLSYIPADIETNTDSANTIIENGFHVTFTASDVAGVLTLIENTLNVADYEIISSGEKEAEEAVPVAAKVETAAAPVKAVAKSEPKAAPKSVEQINSLLGAKGGASKQSLISVNLNKLDTLQNLVGEIVITEAMVTSNPDLKGLRLDNFQKAARQLRKLNSELQDTVMSIRMVPISGAFNKMTRIVRDMKVKLGKDVDLVFEGEETEVDKSIIDQLNDPLMHMVRNSMDHGIEKSAEIREANGKSAKAKITLSAYNSSGEVIIVVSDDGGGIDPAKILAKAEKNGLLTRPASEYAEKEILNMIMLPGFSTNENVTEFSGRGVGMDVVRKNIEKIGGTVSVDSKLGEGTNFVVKIPLSLSIVDGMEVSVGKSIFTIPISSIKESFKVKPEQIVSDTKGHEMIMVRGDCFPLIRLYDMYELDGAKTDIYDGILILVEADERRACIFADELMGEQQVVVKPFSPLLNNFNVKQNGMAGCSILGDGSITIILDIANILAEF